MLWIRGILARIWIRFHFGPEPVYPTLDPETFLCKYLPTYGFYKTLLGSRIRNHNADPQQWKRGLWRIDILFGVTSVSDPHLITSGLG